MRIRIDYNETSPDYYLGKADELNPDYAEYDWSDAIRPLNDSEYDLSLFVNALNSIEYSGPVILHTFGIKDPAPEVHLKESMAVWNTLIKSLN
jgi:hypothetical protein